MSIVAIGDIGGADYYHLGDEAMFEAALQQLRMRGLTDVVAITKDPSVAARRYGIEAIACIGFSRTDLSFNETRLSLLSTYLTGNENSVEPTDTIRAVDSAVKKCTGVLISGGGNISSDFPHHLYERVALVRIAKRHQKPVVLTSQTVGPRFHGNSLSLFRELLDYSTLIGLRERSSFDVCQRHHRDGGKKYYQGLDDAALLHHVKDIKNPVFHKQPYAIGSFASHQGDSDLSREQYYRKVAETLDLVAASNDVDVILIPHVGTFVQTSDLKDQIANKEILKFSTSGRIKESPMLSAVELVAATRKAVFSISTRYHPTVFGPSNLVPAIGLILSQYSSVRMIGALENYGLQDLAIPLHAWTLEYVNNCCREVITKRESITRHLAGIAAKRDQEAQEWWDGIAKIFNGERLHSVPSIEAVEKFRFESDWSKNISTIQILSENLLRVENLADENKSMLQLIKRENKEIRKRLKTLEKKRISIVQKAINRIARLLFGKR